MIKRNNYVDFRQWLLLIYDRTFCTLPNPLLRILSAQSSTSPRVRDENPLEWVGVLSSQLTWSVSSPRVKIGAKLTFRALIPPADKRIPLTLKNGIMPLLCYLPLVFMAYLARRSDTYLIRLLLLPLTICAVLCAAYHFVWTQPLLNLYNWGHS